MKNLKNILNKSKLLLIGLATMLGTFSPLIGTAHAAQVISTINYNNTGELDFGLLGFSINGSNPFNPEMGASQDITYDYESGNVTFQFDDLWIAVTDSITINDVAYPVPNLNQRIANYHDQVVTYSISVPYSNTYNVTANTRLATAEEQFIGNFLWQDSNPAEEDDYIAHGTLEFVSAKYNNVTYTDINDAITSDPKGNLFYWNGLSATNPDGSATFPVGTELTVRLTPDAGYQLTSFGINHGEFTPQDEIGTYTFTIRPGNGHFGAKFTQVDDAVATNSEAIASGSITLGGAEASMATGTARLDVEDVNLSDNQISNFRIAAGDYTVKNYLDISLYNTVFKGNTTDSWDTEVTELDHEATITLQLEDGVDGNDIVIIHEKHDGTYEVIATTYDPINHTITFKTSSFSNYAIATKPSATAPATGVNTTTTDYAAADLTATIILFLAASILFAYKTRKHIAD